MISILALAMSAVGLVGQQDDAVRERQLREEQLVEKLDRLMVHYKELRQADRMLDSILRAESRAAQAFATDTAAVGPFLVIAGPDQIDDAIEVYSTAWDQMKDLLFGWSPPKALRILPYLRSRERYDGPYETGVFIRPWTPRSVAEASALETMKKRVFEWGMPRDTRMWAPELGFEDQDALEFAYRNLIVTAAESARECFEGDADRCWDALGLRNVETSWESWYDADERRLWARQASGDSRREVCPDGPSECFIFVTAIQQDAPIPAQPQTRASFLGHALKVGGEGALVRLNAGDENTSFAERLVFASGTSPQELIESWRAEVLSAAPPAKTGLSLKLLSGALLWSLVLSGFSMRSTRWRA
jgi:hypothetical protein